MPDFIEPGLLVPIVIIVILVIVIFSAGYRKAPPDKAFIISGLRRKAKVVIGKATVKLPFFERCDVLELALMSVDVKTAQAVPTADYINISVDAVVNVKISPDPDIIQKAQQNFLNRNVQYITGVAREVLEGNMREIVGQMRLEEMVSNRQAFADKVKQNADPDLRAMGLEIVSFNVQNFVDDNGIINDMGIDNTMQIKKKAAISKAEAERDIKIAQAEAVRAKAIAEAEGLDKKAEAMRKMEEAAVLQMYFEKMPEVAQAIAKPLENVDKITMYGDGNTAKLVKDITEATTQASAGLLDGLGVDLKSMVGSFITGKAVASGINSETHVNAAPEAPAAPVKPAEDLVQQ